MEADVHRQLSLVDWDFIERGPLDISAIHWYPGSFAPGLPGVLIDLLSKPDATVFDPFCGIGSTAVAAILRGRNSVSCDINPVGVMSGLATAGLLSLLLRNQYLFEDVFDCLREVVEEVQGKNGFVRNPKRPGTDVDDYVEDLGGNSLNDIMPYLFRQATIESLRIWYHPKTLVELQRLIDVLEASTIPRFAKVVGFTMLSAIARSTSSETRSWGHVADNVRPREFVYKDVMRAATTWLQRTRRQLSSVRGSVHRPAHVARFAFSVVDWTLQKKQISLEQEAELLLTSPPYGGAIDYGLAQRLTMYFMGMSDDALAALVSAEIGARRKRSRPGHINLWAEQLVEVAGRQLGCMAPASYAAYVLPHKDHGRDMGELMLKEALSELGWALCFSADRSVRQSRTRQSWTSIKKETILVFRRGI
ncbi:DNA methyltransferase [Mesorhizobium sp. WSM1293]|uniref:DNA methyltransferase n=1 Tax=Mesorhizobium sp. WSM1293 TaxID=1040984 RepID=UPI0004873C8F|nr:DNA methyltransferase [Mesorhizobium sp. WSM1293]